MNTAKEIRSDILEMLISVDDLNTLKEIHQEIRVIFKRSDSTEEVNAPSFMEGVTQIRKNVSLEEIMKEQNYKPCTYEEFRAVADAIDWGDVTLEELLDAVK